MTLKQVVSLLWRWSWLIVLGTAVAGTTAYIASRNTTPLYRATSRLYVDRGTTDSDAADASNLAPSYAALLQTRPVLEETIAHLNLAMTTEQLTDMLAISVPENTHLITLSVNDTNSERAALIANTMSQVFINQNRARNAERYAEPIATWQTEVDAISAEIAALQGQTAVSDAQDRYAAALNSLAELQVLQARESNNVVQVETAQSDPTPILPHTSANVVWAIIIGAIITTTIILLIRPEREPDEPTAVVERLIQAEKAVS